MSQALPTVATCHAKGEARVGLQRLHAQNPAASAAALSEKKRTLRRSGVGVGQDGRQ
jgi:hypothetical protein